MVGAILNGCEASFVIPCYAWDNSRHALPLLQTQNLKFEAGVN